MKENAAFDLMEKRLQKIVEVLNDPYKPIEVKYGLVEEIIHGEHDL